MSDIAHGLVSEQQRKMNLLKSLNAVKVPTVGWQSAVGVFTSLVLAACLCLAQGAPSAAAELRFAFQADAASLDPDFINEAFTQGFLNNIYEGLVRWDDQLKIEPALATDWKMEGDTVWVFNLRHGVKFHDGRPFTADDVVFSFERAMGPTSNYRPTLTDVEKVEKVDDYAVRITTKRRYAILPRTVVSVFIMSKSWATEHDALAATDIKAGTKSFATTNEDGTGPFRVVSRRPDEQTRLEAYTDWWDKPTHNLTAATFIPIKNASTRTAALLSGEVDLIWPVPLQDVQRLKQTPGFEASVRPSEWDIILRMNLHDDELHSSSVKGRNPFKDVRVREALYRAIDIDAINKKIMLGMARLVALPLAPTTNGYDPALDKRPTYDPEVAKKLLAEAGYPDGFDFTLDCPNDRYINDEVICQSIVAMWARVGLKPSLASQERVRYFAKLSRYDSDVFMIGWAAAGTKDGHNTLIMNFATPDATHGGTNYGRYANPELDRLIDDIAQETDPTKRQQLFSQAFTIIQKDWAGIPLFLQPTAWGMRKDVHALQLPDDNVRLWRITVDQ
jgi:peptide/nickel transport system substrate-binding protein